MPEVSKNPAIIAKDLHISGLIIRHIHQGGQPWWCCQGCMKCFWIPSASVSIRGILSRCVVCCMLHGAVGQQKMADLPLTGFYQMNLSSVMLGLINLDLLTSGVEGVASSLDTDSFINPLRHFIARGQVKELNSDYGTIGVEHKLRSLCICHVFGLQMVFESRHTSVVTLFMSTVHADIFCTIN